MNSRDLWTPKRREVEQQCASCPFRVGNDKELTPIIAGLKRLAGKNPKVTRKDITNLRIAVRMDQSERGDFSCHNTVYDKDMNLKPKSEWRQCKGATEHYKACGRPVLTDAELPKTIYQTDKSNL